MTKHPEEAHDPVTWATLLARLEIHAGDLEDAVGRLAGVVEEIRAHAAEGGHRPDDGTGTDQQRPDFDQ